MSVESFGAQFVKAFKMFKKPTEQTIDTVELLNQLRNTCESLIGEDFKYSDIYNEFLQGEEMIFEVYTDGSTKNNGYENSVGGGLIL